MRDRTWIDEFIKKVEQKPEDNSFRDYIDYIRNQYYYLGFEAGYDFAKKENQKDEEASSVG